MFQDHPPTERTTAFYSLIIEKISYLPGHTTKTLKFLNSMFNFYKLCAGK